MDELKAALSLSLPGEQAIVAIMEYATVARQTQSDAIRDGWDKLGLEMARDTYTIWRRIWSDAGVLPPKE